MKLAISVLLAIALLASFAAPAEAPNGNEKKAPDLFQRGSESVKIDSHNKQNDGATVKGETTSLLQRDLELGNIDSHKKQNDGATVKKQTTSLLHRDRESVNADSHNKNDDEGLAVKEEACEKLNEAATSKESTLQVLRRFVARHKKLVVGGTCVCLTIGACVAVASALASAGLFPTDGQKEWLSTTFSTPEMANAIVDFLVPNSTVCRGDAVMSWDFLQLKMEDPKWLSTCYTRPAQIPQDHVPAWYFNAWKQRE